MAEYVNGYEVTLTNLPIIVRELAIQAIINSSGEELNVTLFENHAEEIYEGQGGYNIDQSVRFLSRTWKDHAIIEELNKEEEAY